MACVTTRTICSLALIGTFVTGSSAGDNNIYWVGGQQSCGDPWNANTASFHDGNFWLNFVVPGTGPGEPINDVAVLGSGLNPQGLIVMPSYIYFGTLCKTYTGSCSDALTPASDAIFGRFVIPSDDWVFDMGGSIESGCDVGNPPVDQGSLWLISPTAFFSDDPQIQPSLVVGTAHDLIEGQPSASLLIRNGTVNCEYGAIASTVGSTGALTLENAWLHSQRQFVVGRLGDGELDITSGSLMTVALGMNIGGGANAEGNNKVGHGSARVTGANSMLEAEVFLQIPGSFGSTGSLEVLNGGSVHTGMLNVGGWDSPGEVVVSSAELEAEGPANIGGSLVVTNGGQIVGHSWLSMGEWQGSNGVMEASGNGTEVILSQHTLWIGYEGEGTLSLTDGAVADINYGITAADLEGSSGVLNVSGDGTLIHIHNGRLQVGLRGAAIAAIEDGAEVIVGPGVNNGIEIGSHPEGVGELTIRGEQTQIRVHDGFIVTGWFGPGELHVEDGAMVELDEGLWIGYEEGGEGQTTITGLATSLAAEIIVVGNFGSGALLIEDGAQVIADRGYIAFESPNDGAVLIDGEGSTWHLNEALYHHGAGSGSLELRSGGRVLSDGDYLQTAGSTLIIEVDSKEEPKHQPLIHAFNTATLGGTLIVEATPDFDPDAGATYDLIRGDAAVSGAFINVTLPQTASGLSMSLEYLPNVVRLVVDERKCSISDLNCDSEVDGTDLAILLGAWGACSECQSPDDCPADLNGDCQVDGADLAILLGNWG